MANNARFDPNTLAAVKPGVDGALAEISLKMEQYLKAPAQNVEALEVVCAEFHRLLGVLRMVGLDGLVVYCAEFEQALSGLKANPKQVSDLYRDVLRRALFAVTHFLDALADGADNAALRLFPQYQELQQLRGSEMAFEMDLFYPNLAVQLPQQILKPPQQEGAASRLKVLRIQYQQGLLRWLRQEDTSGALQLMQQAVGGAIFCEPQDDSRGFWWISYVFLDCLKLDGLPPETNARKLLGRIDQQMRIASEGVASEAGEAQLVANEMLYLIGRSHVESDQVKAIRQVYSLDKYLPEVSNLQLGELDQQLSVMRDQLRVAEESWDLCVQGDKAACEKFFKYAEQIKSQSEKFDRDTLQYLATQIQVLSHYASTPEHARPIALDMAMALLLLGSGIENYNRLGSGFQQQARILSERMQATVKQQPEDEQRMSELVDLNYQMEQQGDVMASLANEMLVNLQHVEEGLNAFFNDPSKRGELTELLRLLGQIQGGLSISSLKHAEQLLMSIQKNVRRFSQSNVAPRPAERYALADAMSALENYMQHLTHGQSGDVSRLLVAMADMVKLDQPAPAAQPVAAKQAQVPPVAPAKAEQPRAPTPTAAAPAAPVKVVQPQTSAPLEPVKTEQPQAPAPVEPVMAEQPQAPVPAEPVMVEQTQVLAPAEPDMFEQTQVLAPAEPDMVEQTQVLAPAEPVMVEQPQAPVPAEPDMFEQTQVLAQAAPAEVEQPKATPVPQRLSDEEQELLDIFLEEAQEVLGVMRDNLDTCKMHPDNHEALVTIRRGFHTLKGSGRMVGLTDLGEVAWCVERAMNKWLQEKKPATPWLLNFINEAEQSFSIWVEMLKKQGVANIEANELIANAQQIENGIDLETPAISAEQPAPEPIAEPEPVQESMTAMPLELEQQPEPGIEQPSAPLHEPAAAPELEQALAPEPELEQATEMGFEMPVDREQEPAAEQQMEQALAPELEQAPEIGFEMPSTMEQEPAAEQEMEQAPTTQPEQVLEMSFEPPVTQIQEPAPEPEAEQVPVPDLGMPDLGMEAVTEHEPVQAPATAAEEEVVVIGEIVLPQDLFEIASLEAMQNVSELHKQYNELSVIASPVVQYDFMRAAHTLGGVCRTMGFDVVVSLAHALEEWLRERVDHPYTLSKEQMQMLEQSIAALDEMVQSICNLQMPQLRDDLANLLTADKGKLGVAAPEPEIAPVEMEIPAFEVEIPPVEAGKLLESEGMYEQLLADLANIGETAPAPVSAPETKLQPAAFTIAKPAEERVEAEKPQVFDDIDDQLLPVFLEEAEDLAPKISEGLRTWRENPHDEQSEHSLKRLLHTMKGSSRMVGAMRIGEISHEMETQVLSAAKLRDEAGYWDKLESEFDRINALLEELRGGKPVVEEVKPVVKLGRRASDQPAGVERRADRRGAEPLGNMLRVRADVVDRLVNEASEISVVRSRMETEMRVFKGGLLELTASVMRLRQQLREVEIQAESQMQARVSLIKDSAEQFDPLEFDRFTRLQELTRFMNESVHDVQTVQHTLLKNLDETAAVMLLQGRLNRELQQGLMNVRMVSFNSITDRLYRIVRQTCKELNKRANLELQGTGVELDRSVLEKMIAPFEHLLRNSIVHGLENDLQRERSGKNPIGEIRLKVRQESNEVVFEFSDDGAGLNFAKLREKAIAKGMMRADEAASDEQLAQLIFMQGISTATEITEIAGRGIGMDVVRSEISTLGGRIDVSSKRGQGTLFTIRLPLTLAVTHVVMVRSGDSTYAIPSTMVEQVRQVKMAEMEALHREQKIDWQGNSYPLHYLPHLLGNMDAVQENQPRNPVLLLRSGEQRVALHVDELLGNQEAMVKNIGPQLARLSGIAGATVLGNGEVVLILNPPQQAQRLGVAGKAVKEATVASTLLTLPVIMVVDDSLTVRKITSRMLTRAGYQVVTATDGVDALEKLAELGDVVPEVMLLDIEMPRMDGFALAKHLRRDPKTKNLPIIMITSRTADKHRDYAMQLGVNTYLGKPYQEDELLQNIADFVAAHKLDA
jgi:chemosensory pili system protein ChpA (sensor histidine kinase/response regulator)